jgi:hypothetical protein
MVAYGRTRRLLAFGLAAAIAAACALTFALARAETSSGASAPGAAIAAIAANAGSAARPASAGAGIPKPPPAIAAARRRRARADAASLLGRVRLPAGAKQLAGEPAGDGGTLSRPATRPAAVSTLVDEHTWWRAPGSAASVLDYVNGHVPRGGKLVESASQGPSGGGLRSGYDGFVWPPVGRLLGSRQLLVQVTNLAGGGAGVRVDAQVQWIIPRPVSERIPQGVHEVDITRGAPGEAPTLEIKVVSPSNIRALVAMVNGLGIVQPGAYSCPSFSPAEPVVTFKFLASDEGAVLASASQLAGVSEPTTPCDPMTFSIRGHARTALLGGARVVTNAGRMLGVHLHTLRP